MVRRCPCTTSASSSVNVSIHAPKYGATPVSRFRNDALLVSIHAPKYGATAPSATANVDTASFNPRTQVWCDMYGDSKDTVLSRFNPRTQVWCDYPLHDCKESNVKRFNPRTQVWCDEFKEWLDVE